MQAIAFDELFESVIMAIARPVDRRLFFVLDRAHTELTKRADHRLRALGGITTAQASVLIYLGYHDLCFPSDLAAGIGRNRPTVSGLLTRMEGAGLIRRAHGGLDGRRKRVALTELGREKRVSVMEIFREFNEELAKGFNQGEMDIILRFLGQGVDNIDGNNSSSD